MKTVIEFVTDLTRVIRNTDLDDPVQFAAFRQVAEERIQQFADEQTNKWISVQERLPDVGVPVITYPYSMVTVRYIKEEDGVKVWFFDAIPVTHWQPLPAGPPYHESQKP